MYVLYIIEMQTHTDIIKRAGGATELGRRIGVDPNTVHAWKRANSIPAAYWRGIAEEQIATLDQLADAAAARRVQTHPQDAAA